MAAEHKPLVPARSYRRWVAETSDVLIIGAGVHGASAAYHLAARGASVRVLEKGYAAGGPTGRSSAVVRAYYTNGFLARVARDAIAVFESFDEQIGGDAGFRRTGALWMHGAGDVEDVHRTATALNELGIACDVMTHDDVVATHPRLVANDIAIAVWEHGAGYADPVGTTAGLLERAVALGARYTRGAAVVKIAETADRVRVVTEAGDAYEGDRLLIAAGPWTKPLAAQVGADLPLTVERHIVATFAFADAPRLPYVLSDTIQGYYFKPEGETQFLVGPLHEEPPADADAFDEDITETESLGLASRLVRRVPDLVDAAPRGGWASLYDVSPDWQPVIGAIGERTFVDAGTSGHGFKLAPALGAHVAGLVLGDEPDAGLRAFSPERFSAGSLLAAGFGGNKILG